MNKKKKKESGKIVLQQGKLAKEGKCSRKQPSGVDSEISGGARMVCMGLLVLLIL